MFCHLAKVFAVVMREKWRALIVLVLLSLVFQYIPKNYDLGI